MTIAERIERIRKEIYGVAASYGVTSKDHVFMESIDRRSTLTPPQEKWLRDIEAKVFGEERDDD